MLIAVAFLINSAGNFTLGVMLSAILGPAEFGRYATVALTGLTLAGGVFDWLRFSTVRFAGDAQRGVGFVASLEAAYFTITLTLLAAAAALWAFKVDFGLGATLACLTPLYTVAISRVDYSAAQFRARDLARPYALIFALRQALVLLAAGVVAYVRRDAATAIAALAIANLAAAIALSPAIRVTGATFALARRRDVLDFLVYAKPLVASFVLYALISLINRQAALARLGAAQTGEFSLAFDLSQRLFQALYALPEIFLFQHALRTDRERGREAAKAQLRVNAVIALTVFLPIAVGYFVMGPTFERLIVPAAYRGEFARLGLALAPGLICYGGLVVAVNPVFQLAKRTWPVTAAAVAALATDVALLALTDAGASVEGLARAYSISLGVGAAAAAGVAFRDAAVRPRLRDLAVVLAALAAMIAVARPFNAVHNPLLAAAAAVTLGGAVYAAIVAAFDVAGLRTAALGWARAQAGAPAVLMAKLRADRAPFRRAP